MKVFWGLIAVLLIAATAVAFMQRDASTTSQVGTSVSNQQTPPQATTGTPEGRMDVDGTASEIAEPAPVESDDSSNQATNAPADTEAATDSIEQNADDDQQFADITLFDDAKNAAATVAEDQMTDDSVVVETAEETTETVTTEPETAAAPDMLSATVEEQEDGSLLIAGKYTVRGSGAMGDPYVVPWDLLVSISSAYRPREGLKELPEFIMRLHDKQVKITGYVAFPMVAGEIEELLVMLNQWDGCCVGVPPTVYDSVEVRLIEPITTTGASTTMPYGTVMGRMTIDPYFVNEWLVGLYLMEDAEIEMDF